MRVCTCFTCTGFDSDDDDDLFDDDLGGGAWFDEEDSVDNTFTKESAMGYGKKFNVGDSFTTGNSTVNQLPEGAVLQVVGKGEVEIIDLPVSVPQPGDRISSEYGPATVVRPSSRLPVSLNENEVLYVADKQPVVRRQQF